MKKDVRKHLNILIDNFGCYFPDLTVEQCITDPFTGSIEETLRNDDF